MEEIRIYHLFWKRLLRSVLIIVLSALLAWLFAANGDNMFGVIFILYSYCILYGFFLIFESLWEKISHRPYLVISDKGIAVNGLLKKKYIDFSDVVGFNVKQFLYLHIISVFYNPEASKKKLEGLNVIQRLSRQRQFYQEGIDVSFINMDAYKLCKLLNERLFQNPLPVVEEEPKVLEEEPQVLDEEAIPVEQTSLPETEEETIDAKIRHGKDIHKKKTGVKISILLSFIVSLALFYLYGYEKNASVQFELGLAYYNGTIGDKPNYEKAVKYFRKAAEHGNADAKEALEQLGKD